MDSGVATSVVDAYLDLANGSGDHLIFLATSEYPNWDKKRIKSAALVASSQDQLAESTCPSPNPASLPEATIDEPLGAIAYCARPTVLTNAFYRPFKVNPVPFHLGLRNSRL